MSLKTGYQHSFTWIRTPLIAASGVAALLLAALLLAISAHNPALAAPLAGIDPPTPDWATSGEAALSAYGYAVSNVGDVDGDGYDDVVVGSYLKNRTNAPFPDPLDADMGRIYLSRGSASGLDTTASFTATGEVASDWLGYAVSGAGDINGDKVADFIATAPGADASGGITDTGKVYVFLGQKGGVPVLDKYLSGEAAGDQFGWDASGAGDVNGDGYDDIIVGAWQHARNGTEQDAGKVYVYYGSGSGISATPAFTAEGEHALDGFGVSVSGAGDVNSDGYADIIVGAWQNDDAGPDAGKVYVYHGSASGLNPTPAFTASGETELNEFGAAVGAAGDVNGDGYDDVIVGAYRNDDVGEEAGKAYVFLGSADGLTAPGIVVGLGERAGDEYGFSVDGAGDVNDDGFDDVIIGAHRYDINAASNQDDNGKVYVYAGCIGGPFANPVFATTADNTRFGRSVSAAGDVNGDGYDDLLAGAWAVVGRAYAYHGAKVGACTAKIKMSQSVGLVGVDDPCSGLTAVTAPKGATVAYCYQIKNKSAVTLTWHSLVDSELGNVLNREPITLGPGAKHTYIVTATADSDMTNQSVWTAGAPILAPGGAPSNPPGKEITATASASVSVTVTEKSDDSDGDGIPDVIEGACDNDGDGISAHLDPNELGCASVQLTQGVAIAGFKPDCADINTIQVPRDTNMEYCYTVTNTGNLTLTQHQLTSDSFGTVLSTMTMDLLPGASYTISDTEQIHVTTVNTATWTADTPLLPRSSVDVAASTVTVSADTDDTDGDGVPDNVEKTEDEDGDGIPAFLDPDEPADDGNLYFPMIAKL